MTGVEGYLESAAIGILTGLNAHRRNRGLEPAVPPKETVLARSVTIWWRPTRSIFAPMNSNWGIVPELSGPPSVTSAKKAGSKANAPSRRWSNFEASLDTDTQSVPAPY